MQRKLQIWLDEIEVTALKQIAEEELRGLKEQIHYLLRQELLRRGLITMDGQGNVVERPEPAADQAAP